MSAPRVFITGVAGVVGRMLRKRLSHVYRLSGADRVRLREPGFDRIDLRMDIAHRGGHHLVPSSGGCQRLVAGQRDERSRCGRAELKDLALVCQRDSMKQVLRAELGLNRASLSDDRVLRLEEVLGCLSRRETSRRETKDVEFRICQLAPFEFQS